MLDLNLIDDNSIIICPNNIKKALIKELNDKSPLKHIKLLSKSELLNGTYYTYYYEAIYYVVKTYNYSYENAKEIMSNLTNLKPINEKLSLLNKIYNELNEADLLKRNELFKHIFINKSIYIYNYSILDVELKKALEVNNINAIYLKDEVKNYKHNVYEFITIEEEVNYAFNKIMELIENGVDLNNIYLYQYPSDYDLLIDKMIMYYNLPFESNKKMNLFEAPTYHKFIEYLKELSIEKAYLKLKEETKYDPFDVLGRIVNCVTKISFLNLDGEEFINLLNYEAKNTALKSLHYKNSIKICSSDTLIKDEDYVFMLGFSLGSYPLIYKDTDFFLDSEKEIVYKNTSRIKSQIEEENLTNFILNTKNLLISYKNKIGKKVFYPSLLKEKLSLMSIKDNINNIRFSISKAKYEVASYLDDLYVYGIDNKFSKVFSEEELRYKQYNHSFKGLNDFKIDKLKLSYSSINELFLCPFKYYIDYVLRLNVFEESFSVNLGNLFHKILEDSLTIEIDFNNYKDIIDEHFKTPKDIFFLNMLLPQVKEVIKNNNFFRLDSKFNVAKTEEAFNVSLNDEDSLTGRIDKIMFDEEGKNLFIIDYKTYNLKFEKKNIKYGLMLQLPIYAYLLNENFKDYNIAGLYIQNVLKDKNAIYEKNPYILNGITQFDEEIIKRLDITLGSEDEEGNQILRSNYVSGFALKKDLHLAARPKGFSKKEINELVETAKKKIDVALNYIHQGRFDISPITVNSINACEHCQLKGICFVKDKDVRRF